MRFQTVTHKSEDSFFQLRAQSYAQLLDTFGKTIESKSHQATK